MGNGPNGLFEARARQHPPKHNFEDAALDLDRGMGSLIEKATHEAVTFGRAVACGDSRALFLSGAYSNPRGKVLLGGECRRCGAHFGEDLLCRIHAESGNLGQSLHRVLLVAQEIRNLAVQLVHLLFDKLQLFERHLQQPPIHLIEFFRSAECVA